MFILFIFSFIIMAVSLIMMIIASLISKKAFMGQEKNSPFECGFDIKSSARVPFSLYFFSIAMIFLISDVEITLFFPLIMIMKITSIMNYILISMFSFFILLLGLYHEWNQGALNWTI